MDSLAMAGKKEYCCEHFAVGCHKEPAKAFDCKVLCSASPKRCQGRRGGDLVV